MKLTTVKEYHTEAKKLIAIAIPILFAQIAQNSMGLVDTIMAGRVSAVDMAAISVGASIWLPLVLFGYGLLLALPPTISYLNGSGQRRHIAHQVRQGIWIVLFSCIPLALLIYNSDFVLQKMDMEQRLADITIGYLHAMVWGLPGYLLMVNFRCLNDGIAKTKSAMVITFLGLLLNIPLNYIFIYGKLGVPAFGAVGCGIATAIVNWVMCLLMLAYCMRAKNQRDLEVFANIIERPNRRTLGKLLKLGFPIAMALCCEVALFALTSLFLSPLGADVVASHQIALNTGSFVFMLPMSLGMATTILVGQRLGEKSPNGAKQVTYSALVMGLFIAVIAAFLIVTLREQIANIFVKDIKVIAMAGTLLLLAALYQFSDTIQVVIGSVLRGYKDTQAILYITLFCYWVVGMPLGYTLARTDLIIPGGIAAKGFWIAFVVSLTIAAVLLFYRLLKTQGQPDDILLARLEKLK
ncbi:multidrug efflux protein [Aggregatibacter actinomycetemcomitans serotype e str. SC1083]|uniref:Multidrug-efflux transporter n=1 Tax=Aggregatibacter actinomycetemcomitans serotype e str. SC1083 TaxID=907488 RepID=G4AAG9_AGGAC|nr:MATE family efflux transporter [Aggregatibacter actinomycetemcomitans]EGY32826.1 multidrug efflux protein [Aggregatibacter actinomycetemcomitans serotype e str. SC1083]KYK72323.1 multidrug transporter MatE [Aggregatibacter actinomycetemcomitans serotype e str. SA3096]KYK80092.1 multidrug transporter MatE [Aggregatibacter actinomycetemcomitans serotype e str. SC936]KYK95132.1 multidrug transporter MatE [Aggregatibacter actinomycetemcomitans serotype e str. ANH9776]TYB21853.1 MATE family effl